ncbi:hypothetical protein ACFLZA_02965 [Candidatus Neomarinimicrobiota bacterium]
MAINTILSEDMIQRIKDTDYNFLEIINQKQKEYNSLKHKIIDLSRHSKGGDEDLKIIQAFEEQVKMIEKWASEESIEIIQNKSYKNTPKEYVIENKEIYFITDRYIFIPPTAIQKVKLKKQDAINLLKNLEDNNYYLRAIDEITIKHSSFKRYRSEYIKKLVGGTFKEAFDILKNEGTITYPHFYEITNPPSSWYQNKFIESFYYHCSNPNGKFKERCGKLKIEKGKEIIIKDQKYICFLL